VFEIIKALRHALHIESTWAFVLFMAAVGAIAFGFLGWLVVRGSENTPARAQSDRPTASPSPAVLEPGDAATLKRREKIVGKLAVQWIASHPHSSDKVKSQEEWTDEELSWINAQLEKQGVDFRIRGSGQRLPPPPIFKASHNSTIEFGKDVHITIVGNWGEVAFADHDSTIKVNNSIHIEKRENPAAPHR
jgi:hypothetical protein